jgi:hypothetical protein
MSASKWIADSNDKSLTSRADGDGHGPGVGETALDPRVLASGPQAFLALCLVRRASCTARSWAGLGFCPTRLARGRGVRCESSRRNAV